MYFKTSAIRHHRNYVRVCYFGVTRLNLIYVNVFYAGVIYCKRDNVSVNYTRVIFISQKLHACNLHRVISVTTRDYCTLVVNFQKRVRQIAENFGPPLKNRKHCVLS